MDNPSGYSPNGSPTDRPDPRVNGLQRSGANTGGARTSLHASPSQTTDRTYGNGCHHGVNGNGTYSNQPHDRQQSSNLSRASNQRSAEGTAMNDFMQRNPRQEPWNPVTWEAKNANKSTDTSKP